MAKKKFVIIGSGAAGSHCALKLRTLDESASIMVISKESYHCYHKYKLFDYLCGRVSKEELFNNHIDQYSAANINLRLSQTVTHIDIKNKAVLLAHKEKVTYDKLLIATGITAQIPPLYKDSAHMFALLNNLEDVELLINEKGKLKQTLIFDGGLTSVKLALALKSLGNTVDYFLYKKRINNRLANGDYFENIEKIFHKKNITLIKLDKINKIAQEKKGYRISFQENKAKTYTKIFAPFGVKPDITIAQDASITCDQGILVNEYFQTNQKDIYAAGDIAQIYNPKIKNYWINFGWPNATIQGEIAAKNMCNKKTSYDTSRVNIFNVKGENINLINGV